MNYVTKGNSPANSRVQRVMVAGSARVSPRLFSRFQAGAIVAEYPKCGGTWLASLVAAYLDLPFPRQSRLPIAFPAVIHGHFLPPRNTKRLIFLTRDPRDVAVSYLRHISNRPVGTGGFWERKLVASCGASFRDLPEQHLLEAWIEVLLKDVNSTKSWEGLTSRWLPALSSGDAHLVRYEDLLLDTKKQLSSVVLSLGEELDEQRIEMAVARYDFTILSGRAPGEEDRTSFYRKGTAQAWSGLPPEQRSLLSRLLSETSQEMGYE